MLNIIDNLMVFTLDTVPVMTTMEKYYYMQHLLKVAIEINKVDYPLSSLKSLMYYIDNICDKFYIKRVFDIDNELERIRREDAVDSFILSLDTTKMYKSVPLIWEHCVRCDKVYFDILKKLTLVKDDVDLVDPFIQNDNLVSKQDRVSDGFLINQVGASVHINPFVRLLELVKRRGWTLDNLESVLSMGVSEYVSSEFVNAISGKSFANFRVDCFERGRCCDDIIVIYVYDKGGPNSPYVVIPLNTFFNSYKKNVDGIENSKTIQDLVKVIFRVTTEEYICVSCLEEMFVQLGTTNRHPDIKVYQEMCRGHYKDDEITNMYHRYNLDCVNTSIAYNVVENLYVHSLGGVADIDFIQSVERLYSIESFTDIVRNEYITYGLFSVVKAYIKQSLLLLYRFAYSYLYLVDRTYIKSLDYVNGDYYRYFTEDNMCGYNIDDLSSVCKIILSASFIHVKKLNNVDIINLLPICKYFFTQKWHIVELLSPYLGITKFEYVRRLDDGKLCFILETKDLSMELYFPDEQKKLYSKYVYGYKVLSVQGSDKLDSILITHVLDTALNKGVFKDSERVSVLNIKSPPLVCFSRPDCKVLFCEELENNMIGGVAPNALPYKTFINNSNTCLNTGSVYKLNIEDSVIYFDRVEQKTKTVMANIGVKFADLKETTIFSDRR